MTAPVPEFFVLKVVFYVLLGLGLLEKSLAGGSSLLCWKSAFMREQDGFASEVVAKE